MEQKSSLWTEAQDRFPEAEQPSLPAVELRVQDWPNLPKLKERRSATRQTHDQRPWSQWQLCRPPVLVLAGLSTSTAAGLPWRVLLVSEVGGRLKPFWLKGTRFPRRDQVLCFCLVSSPVRRRIMPRKRWHSTDLSTGWVQVLPSAKEAFRAPQSGRWRQPKPFGQGSSATVEPTTVASGQQSARGSRSQRQCRSSQVGDSHFGLGETSPHAKSPGGSVADCQSEVCSPPCPAQDPVLQTLQQTRQAACGVSRGSDQQGRRAEGDLRGRSCRWREEDSNILLEDASPAPPAPACSRQVVGLQQQIDELVKEREMESSEEARGLMRGWNPFHQGDPANSRQCARVGRLDERAQLRFEERSGIWGYSCDVAQVGSLLSQGVSQARVSPMRLSCGRAVRSSMMETPKTSGPHSSNVCLSFVELATLFCLCLSRCGPCRAFRNSATSVPIAFNCSSDPQH